jgi:trimethylamine--corrinoid protein Co-methyltransferase
MYNETPELQPIVPSYRMRILSDEQLENLKSATLEILEKTGIHCPSEKALKIYAAHGARVDWDSQIVKFPPAVVLEAMSHAPRYYTLGARSATHDLKLDGTAFYCATDGCGIWTIDFETGKLRSSIKDDLVKSARIADYLSAIGFYWPMVSAQDFPASAPLHELDASFNNTVKHVQTPSVVSEVEARYAVEMARVVAGDEESMRQRPPLSSLICSVAPLAQDEGSLEAALVFARAGIPVGFMSMANTGSTAPATLAGTVAVADAEMVSAMVLVQMTYPGAPTYHSMMPGIMHPRTGAYLSTTSLVYAVGVELAHAWGVPTLAGAFGDGSPTVRTWSADGGYSSVLCVLCGAETGSGMGLRDGSTVLYPEAMVLDAEAYHRVRQDLAGLDLSQQELALDVIAAVGPRGHFLAQEHTRQHVRALEFSELTIQPTPGGGYRDPIQVAREKTDWILEHHHPRPLDKAQQAEFERILQAAERELGN